jgi:DNA-directed RNA polymerase subunit beta
MAWRFVDEDTGEVVSIERNEIILDRDTVIDKDNVEEIIDSNVKSILLHKEDANQADYAIIHNTLQKIQQILKRSCWAYLQTTA